MERATPATPPRSPRETVSSVVFGAQHRIAGTVYGTVVVMGTMTAGAKVGVLELWQLALVVATTVTVLWVAHVYAHALGESIASGRVLDRPTIAVLARREAAIVLAAAAPVAMLVLGAVGLVADSTAIWLGLGVGLLALGVQGVRYARIEQLSTRGTVLVVGMNLGLGLVIVGLKALLAH